MPTPRHHRGAPFHIPATPLDVQVTFPSNRLARAPRLCTPRPAARLERLHPLPMTHAHTFQTPRVKAPLEALS